MYDTTNLMRVLNRGLSFKRPGKGANELKFRDYIKKHYGGTVDGYGNLFIDRRGPAETQSKVMFTAHLDTVHRVEGRNKVKRGETLWQADGAVLGADDGAGVAMLCHLMTHNVPGFYYFFLQEEIGGLGSTWAATQAPEFFKEFKYAVAFDRKGDNSIITHQAGERCCSQKFGEALALALSSEDKWYACDNGGVYTDTAEFVRMIPECTNVSIGYKREHTQDESLDMVHFHYLAQVLPAVKWDELPVERDPAVKESFNRWDNYGSFPAVGAVGRYGTSYGGGAYGSSYFPAKRSSRRQKSRYPVVPYEGDVTDVSTLPVVEPPPDYLLYADGREVDACRSLRRAALRAATWGCYDGRFQRDDNGLMRIAVQHKYEDKWYYRPIKFSSDEKANDLAIEDVCHIVLLNPAGINPHYLMDIGYNRIADRAVWNPHYDI